MCLQVLDPHLQIMFMLHFWLITSRSVTTRLPLERGEDDGKEEDYSESEFSLARLIVSFHVHPKWSS